MPRPRIYEEPRVTTAVRLPRSLRDQLHALAAEQSVSVNVLLSTAAQQFIDRNNKSKKSS